MLTFNNLGRKGRLGNVLFQYSALITKAIDLNCEFIIPNPRHRIHDGQICQLQYFKISAKILDQNNYGQLVRKQKHNYIENINYGKNNTNIGVIDPSFNYIGKDTNIDGFFETEKYFLKYKDIILKEFQLRDHIQNKADLQIKKIKDQYKNFIIIGLHLRRGDMIEKKFKSNTYCNKLTQDTWLYKYLQKAFEIFKDIPNKKFLLFTGGSVKQGNSNYNDVKWCKENFKGSEFIFSEGNSSIEDFGLLKNCDHIILTSSSTFGWWAGYLNKNPNKKVVCSTTIDYEIQPNKDWNKFWADSFIKIG